MRKAAEQRNICSRNNHLKDRYRVPEPKKKAYNIPVRCI